MQNNNFKINTQILSLPPYLSTSWKNVTSLQVQWIDTKPILLVHLAVVDGQAPLLPHVHVGHGVGRVGRGVTAPLDFLGNAVRLGHADARLAAGGRAWWWWRGG